MNNFNHFQELAGNPGVVFKQFCSLCTEEATGTLHVPQEDTEELFPIPICEGCAKMVLDSAKKAMIE